MRLGRVVYIAAALAFCAGCPTGGSRSAGAQGARTGAPAPNGKDSGPDTDTDSDSDSDPDSDPSGSGGSVSHPVEAPDASAPSLTDAATAPHAACSDAIVCDSFEDAATLDVDAWQVVMPNCSGTGEISVDDQIAHDGERSVRVDGGGGYCNHVFLAPKLQGALPDPLYGRFFVRLGAALGPSHVTFFAMHDTSEDKDLRMGGQSEILMWNRESDDATLPELSPTGIAASVKPAAETWLCVEFELAQAGELRTWIDGQAIAGLTVEGDATPDIDSQWKRKADWHPKPSDLRFGWESYGGDAATLWFDDIALGAARLGCSP